MIVTDTSSHTNQKIVSITLSREELEQLREDKAVINYTDTEIIYIKASQ